MIRTLALACFALVAACGDDTTVSVRADMSVCTSGCCQGAPCSGGTCSGAGYHCSCAAGGGRWECGDSNNFDLAVPRFGD